MGENLLTLDVARRLAWEAGQPILSMILFGAVILLGFALLREVTR